MAHRCHSHIDFSPLPSSGFSSPLIVAWGQKSVYIYSLGPARNLSHVMAFSVSDWVYDVLILPLSSCPKTAESEEGQLGIVVGLAHNMIQIYPLSQSTKPTSLFHVACGEKSLLYSLFLSLKLCVPVYAPVLILDIRLLSLGLHSIERWLLTLAPFSMKFIFGTILTSRVYIPPAAL